MYPAVAAALFTPQPARTEQSSTVPQRTLKFPRRLYSEFHFLCLLIHTFFFYPLLSSFFFAVKYLFVPCLNFGEELLCKWRLGSDKMGEVGDLRRGGETMKNNGLQWLRKRINSLYKRGLLLSRLWAVSMSENRTEHFLKWFKMIWTCNNWWWVLKNIVFIDILKFQLVESQKPLLTKTLFLLIALAVIHACC